MVAQAVEFPPKAITAIWRALFSISRFGGFFPLPISSPYLNAASAWQDYWVRFPTKKREAVCGSLWHSLIGSLSLAGSLFGALSGSLLFSLAIRRFDSLWSMHSILKWHFWCNVKLQYYCRNTLKYWNWRKWYILYNSWLRILIGPGANHIQYIYFTLHLGDNDNKVFSTQCTGEFRFNHISENIPWVISRMLGKMCWSFAL